jgi:GxxExxY protein
MQRKEKNLRPSAVNSATKGKNSVICVRVLYLRVIILIVKTMHENEIATKIIGASIEVHKQIGPGLLESTYETCLLYELKQLGLDTKRQLALPVIYKGVKLDAGYRIDLLVEDKVIVEIKSVEALANIHTAQLLTYLRLKQLKLGLLINFNSVLIKNGLKRIVNDL